MASKTRLGFGGFGVHRIGNFSGKTADAGIVVDQFLDSQTSVGAGIKKPGIPSSAPEWLKTTLEILEGRRDNKITLPALRTLSFSASPTKAELEELYAYTNDLQDTLVQILNRLDG